MIQNVRGDGSCGVNAEVEGLRNYLIQVSTEVKTFQKEAHDFIDSNRDKGLSNFSFRGKIIKNRKVRGIRRDTWLEDDAMKRMLAEGSRYVPRTTRKHWLEVDGHFPVMAVMYGVNFI